MAFAPQVGAQVEKLYPVDEADLSPSFFVFRARLLGALAMRDTAFVYRHVAPDIRTSFGADGGIADFREHWDPGNPRSELWPLLMQTLAHGGTFSSNPASEDSLFRFVAPYTFSAFPEHLDAFTHLVIVGAGVRVREAPGLEAPVIAALSYDVVRLPEDSPAAHEDTPGWTPVLLASGRTGYVSSAYVSSPLDYRAGFERRNGRWMMTFFVAGD